MPNPIRSNSAFARGAALALALICAVPAPMLAAKSADPAYTLLAPDAEQALLNRLSALVAAAYDADRGGFVEKRGAPVCGAVTLAFALGRDGGSTVWTDRAKATVDWTWSLYDSVGGGLLESTKDVKHDIPSFEKRTDSNARRLENLMDAWLTTHDPLYQLRAAAVEDYFDRVLLDARGGFVAGQVGDRDLVPESNGMGIQAWVRYAAMVADPRRREFAWRSLDRTWELCWNADLGMIRRGTFGQPLKAPQLLDQVESGRAYLLGAHLGGRAVDLQRAQTIGELLVNRFEDREKGGFRTQGVPDKKGNTKKAARVSDENARAALFLCELSSVTGNAKYRDAARRAVRAFTKDFEKGGLELADWALAVRALGRSDLPARPEWQAIAPVQMQPRSVRFPARRR